MPKTKAKRKSPAKNYLVFTSSCGKPEQAESCASAATLAAAEKLADKAMKNDREGYGDLPKAVFVTKIERTGTLSEVTWK